MNEPDKLFGKDENVNANKKLTFESVILNNKWGFSIGHQNSWSIISEETVEGAWIHPIILEKKEKGSFQALCILSIGKLSDSGTILEYIDNAKSQLANSFKNFSIIEATEKSVNDRSTAWMHYTYYENERKLEEYNVTFFYGKNVGLSFLQQNANVPFQFIFFTDSNRFQNMKSEFLEMIHSLSFPNSRFLLPYISLYGSSRLNCATCKNSFTGSEIMLYIKFPENEFRIICNDCKKL